MSDISKVVTPTGGEYNLKDGSAVAGITRNGDTFTATKRDGTSFTFTQTDTHRPVQVDGTEVLGNNTTPLNLEAGTNVALDEDSGTVTISATDTTYSPATSSANGLMSSTDKARFDGMGMVSFGSCDTSGNLADKEVTIDNENWQLQVGSIIGVRFENSNTYSSSVTNPITLNVNNTGAKIIQCNGEYGAGINTGIYGGAGKVIFYMYDGERWVWINNGRYREDILTSGYCLASSSSNVKSINLTNYKLRAGNVFIVTFVYSNSYQQGPIYFAVNGTSSKQVYINGMPSSSSNNTINAGTYIVHYDGTYYHIRTDLRVPINIQGSVNGYSIGKAVPSNAVFTDTTYDAATATPGNVSTTGAVGTSSAYAREDHVHAISLATGDSNGQVKIAGSNVTVKGLSDGAYVNAPRYVNLGSISSLPGTWTVNGITTDMVCSEAILSNPAAQTGDWTVNTNTANQITLSGSISGTTTVTLVMVPSISITGVKK